MPLVVEATSARPGKSRTQDSRTANGYRPAEQPDEPRRPQPEPTQQHTILPRLPAYEEGHVPESWR